MANSKQNPPARASTKPAEPASINQMAAIRHDAQRHGGKHHQKRAQRALLSLSDGLPAPPAKFDADKQYRVRLKHTIKNGAAFLRPSHDVVLSGAFAEAHRDAISGAKVIT